MTSDPIVAEIREIREQRAARLGYDLRAIIKEAQQRDLVGDRQVVRLPSRRPVMPLDKRAEVVSKQVKS